VGGSSSQLRNWIAGMAAGVCLFTLVGRLLTVSASAQAKLQSTAQRSAQAKPAKAMQVYRLHVPGQWGADISPDGQVVAVAVHRKDPATRETAVDVELWDSRGVQRTAHRTLSRRPLIAMTSAEWGQVRFASDGRTLLIYDGELLHILQADNLEEIRRVDLGLPAMPRVAQVLGLAVPSNGRKAFAVLSSQGSGRGGAVRVYDLNTGALRRNWEFATGYPEFGSQVSWSPDGKKIALSLLPMLPGDSLPKTQKNLQVVNVDAGSVAGQWNTGYLAGPVAFAGGNKVATATAEMAWKMPSSGGHPVRVWDAASGRMLREIATPPSGVRGSLEISSDGRRVVGYVGDERSDEPQLDPESTIGIREQRFRVWELPTWRVVATSPPIQPNAPKRAQLRVNGRGNAVLVYWKSPDAPLLVYALP